MRNFSIKQLFLKPHLALLASVEKKTFSGFDLRLLTVKSVKALKRVRLNPHVTFNSLRGFNQEAHTTLPANYVGGGLG
jgi:hypothetical protein